MYGMQSPTHAWGRAMHEPTVPVRLHAPQIGRLGIPDRDAAHTLQRQRLYNSQTISLFIPLSVASYVAN